MIGIIKSLVLSYWSEENRKDKRSVGGIKAQISPEDSEKVGCGILRRGD